MSTQQTLLLLALSLPVCGCEVPELDPPATTSTQTDETDQAAATEKKDEPIDMSGVPHEPPPVTSQPRDFQAKDGKKGKKSRSGGGSLGAILSTKFTAVNKLTKIQYTQAMNFYLAGKGHYPKTHEEFMEKIIKFNKVKLPKLESGVEYIYDPEDHQLKIHRPEPQPSTPKR